MLREGIFAGALLAFTMSFDDFVISYFVTGNGVSNISIIVYNMTKRTNPTINALSTIVIFVIFVTMLIVKFVPYLIRKKKKGRGHVLHEKIS
jgi:spermidine/putrescine transport system permease protein